MKTMTETSHLRSPARSPMSGLRSPPSPEAPKESAVSRLLIGPLTFISFLISLALIDQQNHLQRLRTHQHSSPHPPAETLCQHIKHFFHALVFKSVSSSPYAYVRSPDAKESSPPNRGGKQKDEPWHWHTKQRHMMAAEMEDAFRVRKWVVVFLLALLVGSLILIGMGWRWVKGWGMGAYPGAGVARIHDAREI